MLDVKFSENETSPIRLVRGSHSSVEIEFQTFEEISDLKLDITYRFMGGDYPYALGSAIERIHFPLSAWSHCIIKFDIEIASMIPLMNTYFTFHILNQNNIPMGGFGVDAQIIEA